MIIIKISRFCVKLREFENGEKLPKLTDFSKIYIILQILVSFDSFSPFSNSYNFAQNRSILTILILN